MIALGVELVIMRFLFLAALMAVVVWSVGRAAYSDGTRLRSLGIGLVIVGLASTAYAWWMVVPEVVLVVGMVLLAFDWQRHRRFRSVRRPSA